MLLCCRLFMILAATGLIAAAIALATDEPGRDPKVEVATIEPGTGGLTQAELEKLAEVQKLADLETLADPSDASTAANDASTLLHLPKKASEISTIVVGPPGLTDRERAKLDPSGLAAPPQLQVPPIFISSPAVAKPEGSDEQRDLPKTKVRP